MNEQKQEALKIGIIGDFDGRPSHLATDASLRDSGSRLSVPIECEWVPTESLALSATSLAEFDALFCSPGSPYKSAQGALNGIRFARENRVPFLGTCGGFQHAVLEFAHHAPSGIAAGDLLVPLECSLSEAEAPIEIFHFSKCKKIYNSSRVFEKFRCSYGLNPSARKWFQDSALRIAGVDENGQIMIMELSQHPFFIGTLFQPQLSSSPEQPHPLLSAFLAAALAEKNKRLPAASPQKNPHLELHP